MERLRKFSIYLTLGLLVLIAFWLLFNANKQIEGVALLISALSLSVASITLNQFLDSKLPDVIVEVTDDKRYHLLTLVVKNVGKMTAYNIQIDFPEKPLLKFFGEDDQEEFKQLNYNALAPANELIIAIGTVNYFTELDDNQLVHEVILKFNTGRKDSFLNRYKTALTLDISAYRETVTYPTEDIAAYKKVPDELKLIRQKISEISDELSRPRREATIKRLIEEKKSQEQDGQ